MSERPTGPSSHPAAPHGKKPRYPMTTPTTRLTFGNAIEYLRFGRACARGAWAPGSFVSVTAERSVPSGELWGQRNADYFHELGCRATVLGYLTRTCGEEIEVGYRPSVEDIFASDWYLLDLQVGDEASQ